MRIQIRYVDAEGTTVVIVSLPLDNSPGFDRGDRATVTPKEAAEASEPW